MKPDAMTVILAVALHGVVSEVTLCHFEIWIYNNLKELGIHIIGSTGHQ